MTKTLFDALQHLMDPSSMRGGLTQYEERPEQRQMADEVLKAFLDDHVALIEAGTGTGKSLAYLLPALLFAAERGEPVIVSTNTITLQEQLLHKDIPIALRLLAKDLNIVLAKGMGNYLCLEKLQRLENPLSGFSSEEEKFFCWCRGTKTGSRSDLPFRVKNETWEAVAADADICATCDCSHTASCFFLAARRAVREAHLVLTNHHLLFSDLVRRIETNNREDVCILPPLTRLIIDEAHHLEDVATEFFAKRTFREEFVRLLTHFASDSLDKRGSKIRNLFASPGTKDERRKRTEAMDRLSAVSKQAFVAVDALFGAIAAFADAVLPRGLGDGDLLQKVRLKEPHRAHPALQELRGQLVPMAEDRILLLCAAWKEAASTLSSHNEKKKAVKGELDMACQRLSSAVVTLRQFFISLGQEGVVHWLERDPKLSSVCLCHVSFDLSAMLREHLFLPAKTTVLCSATLSTNKNFTFCQSRLGLSAPLMDRKVSEVIYPSPFEYEKRSVFAIPLDISSPDTKEYADYLPQQCAELIEVSGGGTMILFTSYASMQKTFEKTQSLLQGSPVVFFKQGDQSRRLTIDGFKEANNSVLFATASFWEGVDIPGKALRSVIIAKLPFDVPTEPLAEARAEALVKSGKNPFAVYSLPRACVKFKQAFGRLIRKKDDRGAVVCLDNRLLTKPYGKVFLNSLPACPIVKANFAELTKLLKDFFSKY
jgi:ATP-dependent DNA helicase DinG